MCLKRLITDILSIDCSKKELDKFRNDCVIWFEKTLGNIDTDRRLIWALLRSVLDKDWVEILSREVISRHFQNDSNLIFGENPIDYSVTCCLKDNQTRTLPPQDSRNLLFLHLMTLLPGDSLSEKIKEHLVEKKRLTPNIETLEEIFAYIQIPFS